MMDGHQDFPAASGLSDNASDALRFITDCLIGDMRWRGEARAAGGIIRRGFSIRSSGRITHDEVQFDETLTFDDGETQRRAWRLFDTPGGVGIDAGETFLIEPGRMIADGRFEITYKTKMGGFWFAYRDIFERKEDGGVLNRGIMKFAGLAVMKIDAEGARP